MSHAMQGAGSIYFATLQGYVINETELYIVKHYRHRVVDKMSVDRCIQIANYILTSVYSF